MSETKYCPRHSDTETNLRCGKCEELICPRCMVQTPVGARCPECARVRRLPTFEVSRPLLARAIAVGLVLGLVGGLFVGYLTWLLGGFLGLFAVVGLGYVIGELLSLAVNQKRGRALKYVAAGAVIVALSVMSVFTSVMFTPFGLLGAFVSVYVAVNRF